MRKHCSTLRWNANLPLLESQTRKLVVLDLNGTLLVREPLPPRASFPPPRHGHGTKPYIQKPFSNLSSYKSGGGGGRFAQKRKRGEQDTTQPTPSSPRAFLSTSAAPAPIPRKSHLRPYMPSFKSYLSHPSTLAWLDTMIWSSAQPHNVGVMVDEVFGENHEFLKAVWARDTLISVDDDGYRAFSVLPSLSAISYKLFVPQVKRAKQRKTSKLSGPIHL